MDCKDDIQLKIRTAYHDDRAIVIKGGDSKHFYGRQIQGETLSTKQHAGVIEYEPSELYICARSGTTLHKLEETISEKNQILPCEPPYFSDNATLGGMVACGLAGPRRASSGSVRDCVLGTEIINGKGELLRFGGKVMKNVAGYDVSRLMCGALGTLGVLMTVTLRLLPKPEHEETLAFNYSYLQAIEKMNQWANTAMPISATSYDGNTLFLRLSGSQSAIQQCANALGGHHIEQPNTFWKSIKEHTHEFFQSDTPLWRISVPPNTQTPNIPGKCLIEWNGALRWYKSDANQSVIRAEAERVGGQASLFKGNTTEQVFHPLSKTSMTIHKNLKRAFDPSGILNPGKMFVEF